MGDPLLKAPPGHRQVAMIDAACTGSFCAEAKQSRLRVAGCAARYNGSWVWSGAGRPSRARRLASQECLQSGVPPYCSRLSALGVLSRAPHSRSSPLSCSYMSAEDMRRMAMLSGTHL